MSPYRTAPIAVRGQTRSKWKSFLWRARLWWKGSWTSRIVRCAICGKGLLPLNQVHRRRYGPGDEAIHMMLDHIKTFPCGHTVMDHKIRVDRKHVPKADVPR